jgi:hypothetical protein
MEGGPRYDFPAVSSGKGQRVGPSLSEARFGDIVLEEEPLYEDVGGDWKNGEWGEQVGTVRLTHEPTTTPGRIFVRAAFVFGREDTEETVTYEGLVPGKGSWQGRGRLGFVSGTGKFTDRGGQLDVESVNPKHWG